MPATSWGVYHNLKESEYTVSNDEAVFFFSSVVYQEKFFAQYSEHRALFNKRMKFATGRNTPYNMSVLADLVLYTKIEKRGFYCWVKGVAMDWQSMHAYALRKMTDENTHDWRKTQKPKLKERLKIMEST